MKPICVKCQRFYRPKRIGYAFIEGMPKENEAKPGTAEPEKWVPYKLWHGDLWECEGCGHQLLVGVSPRQLPLAEHYQKDFAEKVKNWGATFQVNDC